MSSVRLVTCAELPAGDEDAGQLVTALRQLGLSPGWRVWDDPAVDWTAGLVVIRSTWDYTSRRDEFLAWARSVPRLVNPAAMITWNSDKTYLRELAQSRVSVVDTIWVAPGESAIMPTVGEFVIKPSVGAGSKGAGRFVAASDREAATAHLRALHDAGRTAMIQPYLDGVDVDGEAALIYLDGTYSHAVTKGAMLPADTVNGLDIGSSHSLFVEERITERQPSQAERATADRVMTAVAQRWDTAPLYARVDLLPGDDGPVLLELELAEPSLFLSYSEGAADRFAAAIAARL